MTETNGTPKEDRLDLEPLYFEVEIRTGPFKGQHLVDVEMAMDVIIQMEKDEPEVPKTEPQAEFEPSLDYKIRLTENFIKYGVLPQGFPPPIAMAIRNSVIDKYLDLKKNIEDTLTSAITTQESTPGESAPNSESDSQQTSQESEPLETSNQVPLQTPKT